MQVSFNWLKEYVDIDISPEELAEKLTNAGVAVENIEYLNKGISKVVIGKVLEANKHPNAEKLSLCQVTTDGQNKIQVVCGAPNVKAGQKVPFALVGANLPGNIKIKKVKLRGTESNGMICSAQELGMDEDKLTTEQKEGILVLENDAPLGVDIVKYLGLDDCILHLDLTPNRSDCLSIINIAREIAAILRKEVRIPEINITEVEKKVEEKICIQINDPELCRRYAARIVEGVKIGPSPQWLQHKLRCSGIRPINNVVDITNFVLLEMGQPLHAFDLKYLEGDKIIVRKAYPEEKITTLDEIQRELTDEMLVIADEKKPVAIAGVMGGHNSEVTERTTTVLIESAYFNPISVRRTSTKLGLRTDASVRFEKGVNIENITDAADRAAQLMAQLADGKVLKGIIDNYPNPMERTIINLHLEKVNKVLGTNIENNKIKEILTDLNFKIINESPNQLTVEVPPYRPDVTISEDLIEEVARIYGYDNIPTTLPYGATSKGRKNKDQKLRDKLINTLSAKGLNEVINFSFINKSNLDKLLLSENDFKRNAVNIMNPLSEEQGIMRTSLLPGLLQTIRHNLTRRNENLGIFELGKVYFPGEIEPSHEKWILGVALRGTLAFDWKNKGTEVDFYYLKGIIEDLLEELNINNVIYKPCKDNPSYHPGRSAYIYCKNQLIGIIGELHPQVAENYDIPGKNYIAELDVEVLLKLSREFIGFKQLPKFPSVSRDLAIVIKDDILSSQIREEIITTGGKLLVGVEIFDLYKGNQISEGYKSLAFSLNFQAEDRTLTDKEINEIMDKIQNNLAVKFNATLRS